MGLFKAINSAASGLTAERLRMDTIANNIANVNATRTAEGGPYRRQMVIFEPRTNGESFASILSKSQNRGIGDGVRVTGIVKSAEPLKMVYDPGHPDANEQGYVAMPNVNIVTEMVDMITATRGYEANVTAVNTAKNMAMKALEIGK
jgi:flagellar basal-body rod protein FlgC